MKWVPPDPRTHMDHGYFLLTSRQEGMPTIAAKLMTKAKVFYCGHGFVNHKLPHEAGMRAIADVQRWESRHGRKVKIILAPQLGDFPILRQAFLQMLHERLDSLPRGAATSVKLVVSVHGMPRDFVPNEAWLKEAPAYRDAMLADARAVLATYDFGRREVVLAQDHFADPVNSPKVHYLSTNKAFWDGINARFSYVINLPIEFFAENTDTMFSHAMFNFEGFPGFDRYQPVDYQDWSQPYTREFVIQGTHVIYNGVPVGRFNVPIIAAHVQAIESILSGPAH